MPNEIQMKTRKRLFTAASPDPKTLDRMLQPRWDQPIFFAYLFVHLDRPRRPRPLLLSSYTKKQQTALAIDSEGSTFLGHTSILVRFKQTVVVRSLRLLHGISDIPDFSAVTFVRPWSSLSIQTCCDILSLFFPLHVPFIDHE